MTQLISPHHISKSRRRFVTFGGALILAACLTLIKMTLVAVDMKDGDVLSWSYAERARTLTNLAAKSHSPNDDDFVPWPTTLPEPAAGPNKQENESVTDEPVTIGDPAPILDPSTLTEGQIQALQQLAARRQELDERERLMDMRAELNGKTEERLDQQIRQLAALKEQIEAMVTGLDEDEEQKLARLVKIYETMKPKAAAEIFNRLDIPVLLHVVERMKEAKSAVVLGKMDPAIAKRVTTELARRKERPSLDDQDFGT
ncbi:MAG: MotE family protein [Geminicoccaceae bacterium]